MTQKIRHPSLTRLLEFVKDQGVIGPSALASAMKETEQVITNWGSRGVSAAGALRAEEKFGCSAAWVMKGTAPTPPQPEPEPIAQPVGYSPDGLRLAKWFDKLPADSIKSAQVYQDCMQAIINGLHDLEQISEPAPVVKRGKRHA